MTADHLHAARFSRAELLFQAVLHLVVFVFYAIEYREPHLPLFKLPFFVSYAVAAAVVNYFLLPHLLYRRRLVAFGLGLGAVLTGVILLEEFVLERIFFPDSRAQQFPGVLLTLSSVAPVIVVLAGFKFGWDALRTRREVEQLRTAVRESELQFLQSQINPHFLFNNLNNLYAYAVERSPRVPDIILELAGTLRYMLYECRERYVPLAREVEHLEQFIRVYELQIEERGRVRYRTRGIRSGYRIAPLILSVFVENAFKHSTASQTDHIEIDVWLALDAHGTLRFRCVNSYHPQSNTNQLTHGIGLLNVRKRLELLYPNRHHLRIDAPPAGRPYVVELRLQLGSNNGAEADRRSPTSARSSLKTKPS